MATGEICASAKKTNPNNKLLGFYSQKKTFGGGFPVEIFNGPIDVDKKSGFCLFTNTFLDGEKIKFAFAEMNQNGEIGKFAVTNKETLTQNLPPVITNKMDFTQNSFRPGVSNIDYSCSISLNDCIFPSLKIPTAVDPEGDKMVSKTDVYQAVWGNTTHVQRHSGNNVKIPDNSLKTPAVYYLENRISDIYGKSSNPSYYIIRVNQ